MTAEKIKSVIKKLLAQYSSGTEAQYAIVPYWRGLGQLLGHFGGASFIGEQFIVYYVASGSHRFSGMVKVYCPVEGYATIFRELQRGFANEFDSANVINPYRYALAETPAFFVLRQYFARANAVGTFIPSNASALENLKAYAHSLLEMRKKVLSSIEDAWQPFLAPQWIEPTAFYYITTADGTRYLELEFASTERFVGGEVIDELPSGRKENDELIQKVRSANPVLIRPITSTFNFCQAMPMLDSCKSAVKALGDILNNVNTHLSQFNIWNLRSLSKTDLISLAKQEVEGHRWVLREFGIGDPQWNEPLAVR